MYQIAQFQYFRIYNIITLIMFYHIWFSKLLLQERVSPSLFWLRPTETSPGAGS